jgi:hypothetical protein
MKSSSYSGGLIGQIEKYRKLGQQEGAKHLPATHAAHPDTHEVTLGADAKALVAHEQNIFNGLIVDTDKAILDSQAKIGALIVDINQALSDNTLQGQANAALSGDKALLVSARVELIRHEVDMRAFRAKNAITAMAHYPESIIWHWAWILALALIETFANAFFYQNANGLVGGYVVALMVAIVNMGSATGLGMTFRRKNLIARDQKFLGWASFALFIPLTLFCNALFAAFRSSYQVLSDPNDLMQMQAAFQSAWAEAGRSFLFHFKFRDLNSFLLFMTGIGLGLVAFQKGYTSDDPFPGYSNLDRASKAATKYEDQLKTIVRQKVKDLLHEQQLTLNRLSSGPGTLITAVVRKIADVQHARKALMDRVSAIQRDYHLVLDTYRQSNLAIRGIDPPSYFATIPDIISKVEVGAADLRCEELKALNNELSKLQEQYCKNLAERLETLRAESSVILSSTLERFFSEIDEEAKRLVSGGSPIMPSSVP